jgi:hypothetical protein
MPTAIITPKSMEFIDENRVQVSEQGPVFNPYRDQHCLQRLGCRQQDVWRFAEKALPSSVGDVSMPKGSAPADHSRIPLHARFDVVQQSAQWTYVKNRKVAPPFIKHARDDGKCARFGFSTSGRR